MYESNWSTAFATPTVTRSEDGRLVYTAFVEGEETSAALVVAPATKRVLKDVRRLAPAWLAAQLRAKPRVSMTVEAKHLGLWAMRALSGMDMRAVPSARFLFNRTLIRSALARMELRSEDRKVRVDVIATTDSARHEFLRITAGERVALVMCTCELALWPQVDPMPGAARG